MPISRIVTYVLALLVVDATTSPAQARTSRQQQILSQYLERQTRFAQELEGTARFCDQQGLSEVAGRIRQLEVLFEEQTQDNDALPETVQPDIPFGLPDVEARWRIELRKAQQDYARDVYSLAQRALREGLQSHAFHMIREVAFHNPDHEQARRILGYVRHDDRWVSPYTLYMLRKGNVWHERFGWLPKDHVARYEAGERLYKGVWYSPEKEAELRNAIAEGWVVESDHFIVRTNHSLERAVELIQALDDLHRFFLQEFADLFNTPQQMQKMFDDGRPRNSSGAGKHEVWYFRTQEQFLRVILQKQPALAGVNGAYLQNDRISYFYADEDHPQRNIETMYHEVTHQILGESTTRPFPVGEERDFWIVEGFACYMESFRRDDGKLSVGDPRHPRMYWARERVVTEDWFIPTAQFTALGRRDFQNGVDIPTLQKYYSQATGLTHFLLHYNHHEYRDGCIQYLGQLYSPDKRIRLTAKPLHQILDVPFETLDEQYKEYISQLNVQPDG
ncbi:MAG: hypothetical protein ACK5Q5_08160 [Planctomycetaceae bacterium]